jgi:1,4-dihydroxy-2-naphthoyl-CoA hydrolase
VFIYQKRVLLKDTDATGVIYFSALLEYSLEAFESFLHSKEAPLSALFEKGYLFPIVHAEADYKAPLRVGDEISIELSLGKVSGKSFTIEAEMKKLPSQLPAGSAKIVHAFLLKGDKVSSPMPKEFLSILE